MYGFQEKGARNKGARSRRCYEFILKIKSDNYLTSRKMNYICGRIGVTEGIIHYKTRITMWFIVDMETQRKNGNIFRKAMK